VVQQRARVAYEREKEKLIEFISREGKKFDNPAHQSQRKMRMKQLETLMEVEEVEEDSELVMTFPKPFGVFDDDEVLLSGTKMAFGYAGEEELFRDVELVISAKARVAILGKNGCGMYVIYVCHVCMYAHYDFYWNYLCI
jgi:ATPase subunit of ABC transporter with duplicated ATPase domains